MNNLVHTNHGEYVRLIGRSLEIIILWLVRLRPEYIADCQPEIRTEHVNEHTISGIDHLEKCQ